MRDDLKITSAQNPKIKSVVKLRDRKRREKEHRTLLEGYRELIRASEYGVKILECYYCPELFLGENEFPLIAKLAANEVHLYEVPEHLLRKMAYRDRPEGLIAVAEIGENRLESLPECENPLYLVAEAIEKPGNLGAMLRSTDAVAASGMIVCDERTDIYNPNVIRASTGAVFSVPLALAKPEEALEWLRSRNIQTVAASPHAEKLYPEIDLTKPSALVVGAEQYGLSDFLMNQADELVVIPMLGKIDSLNVATAATILLYEAAKQRNWQM